MTERNDNRFFWIVAIALLLLTRLPAAAEYLSIDNVNLAFSLENFDPRIHQPQPPGYPFFVGFARLVNVFFQDAEVTFQVVSLLISALCLPVVFALGSRMFCPWAGKAATILFLFNPVFWHSGLEGPLRPNLALFSLLTAYCAWRCWNGERKYLVWGALALGIGTGFRPDLLVLLFPVWGGSAWIGTRSPREMVQGLAVMGACVLVWVGALIYAAGGPAELYGLTMDYLVDQSRAESVVLGAADPAWMRQVSRLVIWNGIAVIGWLWAVPLIFRSKDRASLLSPAGLFMVVWLVPGLIAQALIHVAAPGHTLFSIPALCLIGAYVIRVTMESIERRELALSAAAVLSVMLFLNFIPLPAPAETTGGVRRLMDVFSHAIFETSLNQIRWLDETSRISLSEVRDFTPPDRPVIIVTDNVHSEQWFMNWRIGRYYLPQYEFWVLIREQQQPMMVQQVLRDRQLEARTGSVPVPKGGRIIWLLEQNGAFHQALAKVQPLISGAYILYTDIDGDAAPFRVMDVEFVPAEAGS